MPDGSPGPADDPDALFAAARARDTTEHQARIGALLDRGEAGCWRHSLGPSGTADARISELGARAPHFDALSALVRRHLRASANMALPIALPPILLAGSPGTGKTWYFSQLGRILGVPFRTYPMNGSSLSEGLHGSHPSWRNAQPGLVAASLLQEEAANLLIFVDEIDKAQAHGLNADPYRPFYDDLEPAEAAAFRDEYLGFPMDASAVMWVLAANTTDPIPAPILDRLEIMRIPEPGRDALVPIAFSIYAEANAANRLYFDP